jgi:hypothetical protein
MKLEEVLPALHKGKNIRRLSWHVATHLLLENGRLYLYIWDSALGDSFRQEVALYGDELIANDWEVLE